jgi:L-amino acid N-acyltransferase YncA
MSGLDAGQPIVRDASERDAAACAAIYAPYVTDTAITFESDPPSAADMPRASPPPSAVMLGSS